MEKATHAYALHTHVAHSYSTLIIRHTFIACLNIFLKRRWYEHYTSLNVTLKAFLYFRSEYILSPSDLGFPNMHRRPELDQWENTYLPLGEFDAYP